jgi:hypothetical protein
MHLSSKFLLAAALGFGAGAMLPTTWGAPLFSIHSMILGFVGILVGIFIIWKFML